MVRAQNLDVKGTSTVEGYGLFYQRVGIGTTSPSHKLTLMTSEPYDGLDVVGGNGIWARLVTNNGNGSFNPITASGDRAIVYGRNGYYGEPGGGFVITPHSPGFPLGSAYYPTGLRLDANGLVSIGTKTTYNLIGWPGSLNVQGEVHAARYYDDDPRYFFDLNTDSVVHNITSDGTVTVDGRVGIGTRSPQYTLDIAGDASASGAFFSNSVTTGRVLAGSTVETPTLTSEIAEVGQARITYRVGIGTSSPQFPLHVEGSVAYQTDSRFFWVNGSGTGHWEMGQQTLPVSIYSRNRILVGTELNVLSDAREKNIAGAIDPLAAARQIRDLEPKAYTWKDGRDSGTKIGFIAQEVDKVVPEAVSKLPARGYGDLNVLNYDMLFTLNVAATKYLLDVVAKQQAEIEALKERLPPESQ